MRVLAVAGLIALSFLSSAGAAVPPAGRYSGQTAQHRRVDVTVRHGYVVYVHLRVLTPCGGSQTVTVANHLRITSTGRFALLTPGMDLRGRFSKRSATGSVVIPLNGCAKPGYTTFKVRHA